MPRVLRPPLQLAAEVARAPTLPRAAKIWRRLGSPSGQPLECVEKPRGMADQFHEAGDAVWDTASDEDQHTVIDWWVDSILVKPGRKEGKRQRGEETVLVVALRSNPEKPKAVQLVQAIKARAATPTAKCDMHQSSRTPRATPHRTTCGTPQP